MASGDRRLAFVVAHGFTGSHDSPAIRRVGDVLVGTGGVVAVSMRGHGRSGGASTVGAIESRDVDAAVDWARRLGYQRIVTVGFSMGGSVVVRHAALCRNVDATVSVSAPSRWYYRGTPSMRRLHRVVGSRLGRAVTLVARGTRVVNEPWSEPLPLEPRRAAEVMAPTPLLVVHGDSDHYFPLDHAQQLAAGGDHVELWVEYGFEHAEHAISDELTQRIAAWAEQITWADSHRCRAEACG
jgi:pimeloyl-ACP methyl ester carboxylesterase